MLSRNAVSLSIAVLLLLALLPAFAFASQPQQDPVHPGVREALQDEDQAQVLVLLRKQADLSGASTLPTKEAKGRYVFEALRAVAQRTQPGLRAMLDARRVAYTPFYIVNALQVRADSELVRSLAARPEVVRILPVPGIQGVPSPTLETGHQQSLGADRWPSRRTGPSTAPQQPSGTCLPQGVEANLVRSRAPEAWALGHTGQGIVVAGQDTGYDWDHPALIDQYRGWDGALADHNYNWHDAIHQDDAHTAPGNPCGFDSPEPCDDHGSSHGTHTMGIIAGDDGVEGQIGMAPDARWIGCRNMEQGWGTPATYIECFEFFLAPYPLNGTPGDGVPEMAPHVVNNSWACPPDEGCDAGAIVLMEDAIHALRQAGIVVVASAGNYGRNGVNDCGSVQYPPAIYTQTLSVGNFNHRNDQIYYSSSRGPATYNGSTYLKPNIAAPGTAICSSIRGGSYTELTGTSMSAPHVAGAVALLLSAAQGYSGQVDAIEYLLTRSAEPMTTTETCGGDGPSDVPNNTWGWGILDALSAVRTVNAGTLQGTVTDAESHVPIDGADVTANLSAGSLSLSVSTNPSGQYTLTLPAGSYDVTGQASYYLPRTITNVAVISGETTLQGFALAPLRRFYLPLVLRNP